jgi:hypothetical protein
MLDRIRRGWPWAAMVLVGSLTLMGCEDDLAPQPGDGSVTDTVAKQEQGTPDQAPGDASMPEASAPDAARDSAPKPDGPGQTDGPGKPDVLTPADLTPPKPDGDPTATCQQLDQLYVQAIQKAKSCSPMLPVVHCTQLVKSKLICPCQPEKTYVEKAVAELTQLSKQFALLGCSKLFACPKIPCKLPTGANCKSGGPSGPGSCVDTF